VTEGALKSLAGLNVLHSATDLLERLFTKFDTVALKISTIATLLGSVSSVAISATASVAAVGDGLLQSLGLLVLAPTALGALFTTLLIGQTVFKDFGAAAHGIEAAMKRLPPAGQEAARTFQKVFADMRQSVSQEFWSQASDSMLRFANNALPAFTRGMSATAGRLGGIFGGILDSFNNLALAGGLDTMFNNLIKMFDNMTAGATAFWDALNIIGLRGSEFLPQFGDWLTKISIQFKNWAQTASDNGDLNKWIREGVSALKEMWQIGGDVIDIFKAIAGAATAAGAGGLADFEHNLRGVADRLNSADWQRKAADIFKGGREGASALNAGFKELKGNIADSSREFGNLLRLLGSIGGGVLANLGIFLGNQNFQTGATQALEGLQTMLNTLRPGMESLADLIGNLNKIAGVAFSNMGNLLSRMIGLVDSAFSEIAAGLEAVTPRMMNVVGSLFEAATPAVMLLAGALKQILAIVALVPNSFVMASVAVLAFVSLRSLASKFFSSFSGTSYFQALKSRWLEQQVLAGKTVSSYKMVDGALKRAITVPTGAFSPTKAVFRDLTSAAGQTAGSLRQMYALAASTPRMMSPMAAGFATAGRAVRNIGTDTGAAARQLAGFYGSLRVGTSTINPQNQALLSMRAAAVGVGGALGPMATQFRTMTGNIQNGTTAARLALPALSGMRGAFTQIATATSVTRGQLGSLYGQFRAAPAPLGAFNAALATAAAAGKSTAASLGKSLLGFLGGGWGVAFLVAASAIGFFAQKQQEAKASAEAFAQTLDDLTGAVTRMTTAMVSKNIVEQRNDGFYLLSNGAKSASETIKKMGASIEAVSDIIAKGGKPYDDMIKDIQDGMDAMDAASAKWEDGKLPIEGNTAALDGWLARMGLVKGAVNQQDLSGLLSFLQGQRKIIEGEQNRIWLRNDSAVDLAAQRVGDFNDAMGKYNDLTATADTRTRALDTALQLLSGQDLNLEDATAAFNKGMDEAAGHMESFSETVNGEVVEKMKLVGGAFHDAQGNVANFNDIIDKNTGVIDTNSEAGRNLREILKASATDTKTVATGMKDAKKPTEEIAKFLETARNNFIKLGTEAGVDGDLVARAYDHMIGANPKDLITVITAQGMEEAASRIKNFKGTLDEIDGYRAVAKIAGDDTILGEKLANSYGSLEAWDQAIGTATADLDPAKADAVRVRLTQDLINLAATNPTVLANMDPRLLDRALEIVNAELKDLNNQKPTPEVKAKIEDAKYQLGIIQGMLNSLHNKDIYVGIHYSAYDEQKRDEAMAARGNAYGSILDRFGRGQHGFNSRPVKHFANGGIERQIAQITKPGGPIRVWSEPSTNGEAFIPYAQSKRPRSVAILAQVAKDFGYSLSKATEFANGGITGSTTTSHTSADVHIGSIHTVDMNEAVAKLRQSQRDALAVAGISSIGV
jgi:hypothetical protein